MGSNILITGAAGYIGGSLVVDFLASSNPLLKKENIFAAVRSDGQAKALSKLGVNVLQLNLTDEKVVTDTILSHKIGIVIHTASALDAGLALPLITALSKQRQASKQDTYFIHTSGLSAFYENTGWPTGPTKDTDRVFDLEKQLAESFPLRKTDVAVIEHAQAVGVTSFIVVPSTVYGRGTGPWNQLSVVLPVYIKATLERKRVDKFAENVKVSGVHISDLTALYGRLVEKILQRVPVQSGEEGYYFALAHDLYWWEVLEHLTAALEARDLLTDSEIHVWPNDKAAAEGLGIPEQYVKPLWNSGENIISDNEHRLGWKPKWDKSRFLQNIDDEVRDVLELGKAKSSLIESLHVSAQG